MTIGEMYTSLNSKLTRLDKGSTSYNRLETIVQRLYGFIGNHATDEISSEIKKLIHNFKLTPACLSEIEEYLNGIDRATGECIAGSSQVAKSSKENDKTSQREGVQQKKSAKSEQPEGQTEKVGKHPVLVKFIDFIPVILGLLVSGIALSLGLTIFNDNQDATYFIAETIKDVLGGVASCFLANQCIVFCKKTKKVSPIPLVGGLICSILAFVFSVVLWILSNYAVVERFTPWDKVSYLWICLSLIIISVISIGPFVCFLIVSSKQKTKTERKH